MSEDCLFLNIWAPRDEGGDKYPVVLWIHGGGLMDGSSSLAIFNGAELAKKGVLLISFNYRLNIFGYLAHPELSAESPHGVSGNYGVTDQIQALKWIKRNISAFGGDPDNITIAGQSAGALSVTHLLSSTLAKGLFHRAIIQSPYMPAIPKLKQRILGKSPAENIGC